MKPYKNILIVKIEFSRRRAARPADAVRPAGKLPRRAHRLGCAQAVFRRLPGKPYIDDIVYIDKKGLKSLSYLKELRRTLHEYHFDMCLDLQGLAKSAIVAFCSGAKEKYGYWEMREGSFLVSKGLTGTA